MVGLLFWGSNLSVAVWVGFIASLRCRDDDSIVMLTYLKIYTKTSRLKTKEDMRELVVVAGMKRIRPCLMTSVTTNKSVLRHLLDSGRGSDVMQPMRFQVSAEWE